jgi:hypothetical protein
MAHYHCSRYVVALRKILSHLSFTSLVAVEFEVPELIVISPSYLHHI